MTEKTRQVVLIHTSDIHSAFGAMPAIASIIEEVRRGCGPEKVATADCGDHLDRMSLLTEGTRGEAHIRVLEAMGYDVVTLGNNEGITLPKERLEELYGRTKQFRVVCANLYDRNTNARPEWMRGHELLERNGIKIGFIGATARYPIFYQLLGWEAEEPIAAVAWELELIRDRSDVVVLLSHLGLSADKRIAEELEGIDVILGGHTHHVLEEPLRHGNSWLFGVGSLGKYVGEVRLYADPASRRLIRAEGKLHHTDRHPGNERNSRMLEELSAAGNVVMQQPVAFLKQALPVDWERDSPLGNLLAAGIRKWTGAELGLINSGQILQSLLPGTVTKGMLLELCPSPVNPCTVMLKGADLLTALEQSLQEEYVRKPVYGNGFRGKVLGGLCVDGLEIVWSDGGQGGVRRIEQVFACGKPLEPEREYRVGTADMFTFGTGYLILKEGRDPRYMLPEFLRDILEKELNDEIALLECRKPRYKVL